MVKQIIIFKYIFCSYKRTGHQILYLYIKSGLLVLLLALWGSFVFFFLIVWHTIIHWPAWNNTNLSSHSFYGSELQAWLRSLLRVSQGESRCHLNCLLIWSLRSLSNHMIVAEFTSLNLQYRGPHFLQTDS